MNFQGNMGLHNRPLRPISATATLTICRGAAVGGSGADRDQCELNMRSGPISGPCYRAPPLAEVRSLGAVIGHFGWPECVAQNSGSAISRRVLGMRAGREARMRCPRPTHVSTWERLGVGFGP